MTAVFSFDAETSSPVDLNTRGADAYSRPLETRCLMLAYHEVGSPEPGKLWLEGDPVPPEIVDHIASGGLFSGWNVTFFDRLIWDRILVPRHGFPAVPADHWIDSMHRASAANLPRSLDACARSVGIDFKVELKDSNRIRRITDAKRTPIPYRVADILDGRIAVEGGSKKRLAERLAAGEPVVSLALYDDLVWLAERCRQDIVLEETLLGRLPEWPQMEPWRLMPSIDRKINDRGILLDVELVNGLSVAATKEKYRLDTAIDKLTAGKIRTTSQVEELKRYLVDRGVELPPNIQAEDPDAGGLDEEDAKEADKAASRKSPWKLDKAVIADLLARTDIPEDCRLVVEMRAEAAKVSASKFRRMLANASPDGRLRNTMTLGGAQQTLRWASRGCNLYNTVRDVYGNHDEIADLYDLDAKAEDAQAEIHQLQEAELYEAVLTGRLGDPDAIRDRYQVTRMDARGRPYASGVLTWISRMTRRTLSASQGSLLLNGDYAQIEARITVWLAQQTDMLHAFATGQDIYKISAAGIYRCAPSALTKTMRQAGKVATLAGSFGGGANALLAMGYAYGLMVSVEEATDIVRRFREANAALVKYWYAVDDAAAKAVMYPGSEFPVGPLNILSYFMQGDCLCCRLPSTRLLRYWQPRLTQEYWDNGKPKDRLSLSGLAIKGKSIYRRNLFHTILVENNTQAIAADMLGVGLDNMDQQGIPVGLHVYDSIAAEVLEDRVEATLPIFKYAMEYQPNWTHGLPTRADVDVGSRFG